MSIPLDLELKIVEYIKNQSELGLPITKKGIAKEFGVSPTPINRIISDYELDYALMSNTAKPDIDTLDLIKLNKVEKLNVSDIADEVGLCREAIRLRFKKAKYKAIHYHKLLIPNHLLRKLKGLPVSQIVKHFANQGKKIHPSYIYNRFKELNITPYRPSKISQLPLASELKQKREFEKLTLEQLAAEYDVSVMTIWRRLSSKEVAGSD